MGKKDRKRKSKDSKNSRKSIGTLVQNFAEVHTRQESAPGLIQNW